jgi:transcriptional regulator with XRE-family HTH domain
MELFAHENGLDKSWLNKVLHGQIDPSFTRMIRLAESLEASLDEFYPRKPTKSRK